MMTFLFFILLTMLIIYIRYEPKFDKIENGIVIWYNESRFNNERSKIIITKNE